MRHEAGPLAGVAAARGAARRRRAARLDAVRRGLLTAPRVELAAQVPGAVEEIGADAVIEALVERAQERGSRRRAWSGIRDRAGTAAVMAVFGALWLMDELRARVAALRGDVFPRRR